jgi:hypothetical protein
MLYSKMDVWEVDDIYATKPLKRCVETKGDNWTSTERGTYILVNVLRR